MPGDRPFVPLFRETPRASGAKPLDHLAESLREMPPLQRGPGFPEVLRTFEVGGPSDPSDRRLVIDRATLEQMLRVAKSSLTGRVVLHRVGMRVQVLDDGAHRWEHVIVIGCELTPESVPLVRVG